jgi:hypothetical protein
MTVNASGRGPNEEPRTDEPDTAAPPDEETDAKCGCCDLGLIDDLDCQSQGIDERSKYNAEARKTLDPAKKQYATTCTDYRTARNDLTLEVQDMRHQVRHLIERIRCQIKQPRVVDCIDRAFTKISTQLDECQATPHCCADDIDCEFDLDCPDDYRTLVDRIAEYQDRLNKAQTCFTDLTKEPQALRDRVDKVKKLVADEITAKLKDDQADLKRVYAAALVAQRDLLRIWNGFRHAKDFLDCLCQALTCWAKGVEAVSVLVGCRAVKDCYRAAHDTRCTELATNTIDEVLNLYLRICGCDCDCAPGRCEHDCDGREHRHHHRHDDECCDHCRQHGCHDHDHKHHDHRDDDSDDDGGEPHHHHAPHDHDEAE